jgi:TPR repeat protein
MNFEDVVPNALLEQGSYHILSQEELEALSDAESIHERGYRLRLGIKVPRDEAKGWEYTQQAAALGHPVALAYCFDFGVGTPRNLAKAVELTLGSAQRGHPAGKLSFSGFV